jgi:hypothetical protein
MASNSSTISSSLERLGYGGPDGCVAVGLHREVISGVGATRTLLPEESGALCLLDAATGVTYTLPAPVVGRQFQFAATVSRTSTNAYKIITNSASVFLVGAYMVGDPTVATSGDVFTGDGTTHVAITLDADTEGGLVGTNLVFTCISATQWYVEGLVQGAGTTTTGFATS